MRKQGGGFGVIMLIVVVAIVLMLVARNWESVAPTAMQLDSDGPAVVVDDRGQTEAGEAIRSGNLPNLDEMRTNTGAHADRVQQALEQIE